MSWAAILLLAAGAYLLKLGGLVWLDGRLGDRLAPITELLPAAMFAALVVVQTLDGGRSLVLDARLVGVVVAVVAVWRRLPFVAVIGAAMAATALARALI